MVALSKLPAGVQLYCSPLEAIRSRMVSPWQMVVSLIGFINTPVVTFTLTES